MEWVQHDCQQSWPLFMEIPSTTWLLLQRKLRIEHVEQTAGTKWKITLLIVFLTSRSEFLLGSLCSDKTGYFMLHMVILSHLFLFLQWNCNYICHIRLLFCSPLPLHHSSSTLYWQDRGYKLKRPCCGFLSYFFLHFKPMFYFPVPRPSIWHWWLLFWP